MAESSEIINQHVLMQLGCAELWCRALGGGTVNSFHPGSTRAPLLTLADLGLGQQREISAKKLIAIGGFPKLNSDDGFQLYKNKSVQRAPKNFIPTGGFP